MGRRGIPGCGGDSMTKTPYKGLRSVSKVLKHFPINDILVSFVLVMINNEFCPKIFSRHSFGRLIILLFLD